MAIKHDEWLYVAVCVRAVLFNRLDRTKNMLESRCCVH